MQTVTIAIYIIELLLIIISIINLVRASRYLSTRNQDLKELIEVREANQELRFDNYEHQNTLKAIYRIIEKDTTEEATDKISKIKEVIQSANINNF